MGISENFGNTSNPLLKNFYKKKVMKILENLCQSSETFGKLRKQIKSVFQCFYEFLKSSGNLRKSSEVFGNLRKFSENLGNGSKINFRCFYDFLKLSENLRKSSEVFGNLREISGRDRKCS